MLIAKPLHPLRTFQGRAPGWALAFIQAGWGDTLLLPGDSFDRPFFQPLAAIASESFWAVGLPHSAAQLAALYINGSMVLGCVGIDTGNAMASVVAVTGQD